MLDSSKNNQSCYHSILQQYLGLEDVLKSISNGIIIFNQNKKVLLANPSIIRMADLVENDPSLDTIIKLFDEGGIKLSAQIDEVLASGRLFHLNKITVLNSVYEVSVTAIKNLDGHVCGGALILHDITNIEEMDRVKTEFLSIAAHQLRTPLGSMRWSIEMLLSGDMGKVSGQFKEILMQIYQSTQRMIILVGDLLIVSRIDQSRVSDTPTKVNILAVIKDVAREVEFDTEKKSVVVDFQAKKGWVPEIVIDSQRFRDVIQNLLSNAVKYNRPGGTVDIVVKNIGDFIQITIADNGIGIPQKDQGKLFTKFFRADNAIRSKTEGSGLGLYVVKSYVEAWGGKVRFESADGKGTKFYVTLPHHPIKHALDQNLNRE